MLTAYIRFKYPNLVDGGLAASAPRFIVANLVDTAAFFAKVTQVYQRHCSIYRGHSYLQLRNLSS